MLKRLLYGFVWITLLCVTATCDKVKEFDDEATISAVKIEAKTHAVVLGTPQIDKDEVTIPLIFGKYLFPIEVRVNIETEQKIDKILGFEADNTLIFESLTDINRVDLVALSGVVHSYIFRLQEVPKREGADIEKFEILSWSPEQFLFARTPYYDIINGFVEIIGISDCFPFTIIPVITLSDGAQMPQNVMETHFTFHTYDTQIPLRVTAESGKVRDWHVKMKQAQIIKPVEAPNADIRARLSLNAHTLSAMLSDQEVEAEIKAIEVDIEKCIIQLFIKSDDLSATWKSRLSFPINPYTQTVGYVPEEILEITGFGLQKTFYLIDMLEGYGTAWKVESVQWQEPIIEIEPFELLGYTIKSYSGTSQTANNIVLNPQAAIDPDRNTITFHVIDWANKFPLKVNGRIEIPPGATLLPHSFHTDHELIFDTLYDSFTFTLISENGETMQTWTIVLQNNAVPKSSAKEVSTFISGAASYGFVFAEKYLEPHKQQITLIVSERITGTLLILAPRITVSPNARLLGIVSGAQLALSFDQPYTFTVQAEDESTATWNILLRYAPQIPNSGFELWGKANNSDMNLLPANGTGWCTSNSSVLSNTTRVVGHNSPYAVQMKTQLQTMNFVIFRITTITAASAFTGKFTLKTGVNDVYNPISMTNMGLPWGDNPQPIAFSIDYKYIRGPQLVYTEPNRGLLIPTFKNPVNITGSDAASLRVELFYHPTGTFDYATARSRNDTMIAKGEILEKDDVPDWTYAYVPIEVVPGKEWLSPTHLVVVLTSSHEGDYFKGAPGSTLTADNFALIYYKPEEGARRLE